MPTISLPSDPDLGQLRKQAKDLQRAVRAGDSAALERLATYHPDGAAADAANLPLAAAQLAVARGYGFTSWARLVRHVEVVQGLSRSPGTEPSGDLVDDFLRSACLSYEDDAPGRRAEARDVLADHPDLPARSIHAAAAAGDPRSLARLLAVDPGAARLEGGPFDWVPLMYLTYSCLDPAIDEADVLAVARLLIEAGIDPNAGYLWHGLPTPFTALTGVFGGGEGGPDAQPHHPHADSLARLLLEAGADANDGQALYNRMFEPDDSHLVLLFEFGLGQGDGGPWRRRLGDAVDSPSELLRGQLSWAVSHDMADRVRLLVDHGVDVRTPFTARSFGVPPRDRGRTPIELARLHGAADVEEVLVVAAGVELPTLDPLDAVVAAVLAGDDATATGLLRDDQSGDLLDRVVAARPVLVLDAATTGRPPAVELALRLGFDVNATAGPGQARGMGETAMHEAAMNGEREIVELLLAAGADPDLRDDRFDATPLGWARHGDQPAVVALLEPVTSPDSDPATG